MARSAAESKQLIKSVPWRSPQALIVFIVPWVILPIVVLITMALLSHYIPVLQSFVNAVFYEDPRANFALVILDAIGSYLTIGYFLKRYKVGWDVLGFRSFSFTQAILLVIGLFVAFILTIGLVYTLVQILLPSFNADQAQTNEFTSVAANMRIYSLLALVVIPPLVEEPVFRGFLFPAFSKRFGIVGGALISSLLFGFAHLQGNVSVYTFVIGLVLCFMYSRLGSIIPGMGLHMLNNYIAYTAIYHTK